jgi:hypothetical protein
VKLTTRDGGSVELTRVENMHDVHLRNAAGETTATVRMTDTEAMTLIYGLHQKGIAGVRLGA